MAGGLNPIGNLVGTVNANGALVVALDGGAASGTVITATTAFILGAATTSGIRLDLETGVLAVREGDDSAYAQLTAGSILARTGFDTLLDTPLSWAAGARIKSAADSQLTITNSAITTAVTITVPTGTGNVVPVTVAKGRATAQAGANASVSTFTVGAADATFEVSANVRVTTATTHAFTVTCAYTDEVGTARTLTMPFVLVAGTAIVTSVANALGTVPYMGLALQIRAQAATAITIATTGTFTTVVYNVEGIIRKLD